MSLGQEVFTDLDFAGDVSVMAEMLEVLILALELMNDRGIVSTWVLKSTETRPIQAVIFLHPLTPPNTPHPLVGPHPQHQAGLNSAAYIHRALRQCSFMPVVFL